MNSERHQSPRMCLGLPERQLRTGLLWKCGIRCASPANGPAVTRATVDASHNRTTYDHRRRNISCHKLAGDAT